MNILSVMLIYYEIIIWQAVQVQFQLVSTFLARKHPVVIETLYALVELISEYKRHSLTEYVFPRFMNSTFCNTVYKSTKLSLEK